VVVGDGRFEVRRGRQLHRVFGCETELRRAGVTLELLQLSISASIPTAIGIRRFACTTGGRWTASAMRRVHTAGEKLFC
jgi:hypothetical protein